MKKIEIQLYTYQELNDKAKKHALDCYHKDGIAIEFLKQECQETWQAFLKEFQTPFADSIYGFDIVWHLLDNHYDTLFPLKSYWICKGHKNCIGKSAKSRVSKIIRHSVAYPTLTGNAFDCHILQPLIDFIKKPNKNYNIKDLFKDCKISLKQAYDSCAESYQNEESAMEYFDINEIYFLANGEVYHE